MSAAAMLYARANRSNIAHLMTAEITSMPTDEDLRALTYVSRSLIQGAGDGIFKVRGSGDWPRNIVISTYGPIVSMLLADVPDDRKDYCVAAHHEQVIFDHPDATRDQEWVWIPAHAMASYDRRTTPHTAFFANTELNSEALEVASHVDAELVGFKLVVSHAVAERDCEQQRHAVIVAERVLHHVSVGDADRVVVAVVNGQRRRVRECHRDAVGVGVGFGNSDR